MAQKPTFDYDNIIIGSGAAGSLAASVLARAGKQVAIIEAATFGGESPNWGDIPTGALLQAAGVYRQAKAAAKFGLRSGAIGYNYPSLLRWRDIAIKRTGAGGNRAYYEKQGISVYTGRAHFLSPNELTVNRRHLSARKFLIATGSEWLSPSIAGLDETPHHTPQTILSLSRPPKSLFIIGSGPTAMELAHLFSSFGTKVYLAEPAARLLPEFDNDVSSLLTDDAITQRDMTVLTQARVIHLKKDGAGQRITYVQGGQEHSVRVEQLLVAENRAPATDIGLENAGVAYTPDGITVHTNLQTSARHIFAAGGCVDASAQTHEVVAQSRIAAHNLLRRQQLTWEQHPRLRVIMTQPEVAQVGLNEDDCLRRDLKTITASAPLTLTARSNITDERLGFVKLITDKKGILLGASIVAPHASDMIGQLALAIQQGLSARQLVGVPSSFVAWSEAIRIAAAKLL